MSFCNDRSIWAAREFTGGHGEVQLLSSLYQNQLILSIGIRLDKDERLRPHSWHWKQRIAQKLSELYPQGPTNLVLLCQRFGSHKSIQAYWNWSDEWTSGSSIAEDPLAQGSDEKKKKGEKTRSIRFRSDNSHSVKGKKKKRRSIPISSLLGWPVR